MKQRWKVEWRCVSEANGALCAMTPGMIMVHPSYANNWASLLLVNPYTTFQPNHFINNTSPAPFKNVNILAVFLMYLQELRPSPMVATTPSLSLWTT